ncbi:hypothetical protein KUA52_13015, partial [Prevotella copri]|uniref:hypothetical protein n=1 Tax=Segatella copri TaxID=165179 RepID=UPI001C475AAA
GKARACESLGFVVNKNNFFSSVSGKRRKKTKRVRHRLMTHPLFLMVISFEFIPFLPIPSAIG